MPPAIESLVDRSGVERHRTAMGRVSLSKPVAKALDDGLLTRTDSFFDYGCGRGGDLKRLHRLGIEVSGWDPAFFPDEDRRPADVVNLGYVVNVVEDVNERAVVLHAAWGLARRLLVVAARLEWEARPLAGDVYRDGVLTGRGTFQKFFAQDELRVWIDQTLGVTSVAAAPGVFYVFRDSAQAQSFVANRVRRTSQAPSASISSQLFEEHRAVLEPLMAFVADRGRLPVNGELDAAPEIQETLGSVPAAFRVVQRATGRDRWTQIREERQSDLLVYLALAAFGRRPRYSDLPENLRQDIRAFFGAYTRACRQADRLLYMTGDVTARDHACRTSRVGKLTPEALYVHVSALNSLPPLLRAFEGCGRTLVGSVDGATVIKLGRREPKISYLSYPNFDTDPHPRLDESVIVELRRLRVHLRNYRDQLNPPILHRKEVLVSEEYPLRQRFARLTAQEERAGLYDCAGKIGTLDGWRSVLRTRGVEVRGHRVFRRRQAQFL